MAGAPVGSVGRQRSPMTGAGRPTRGTSGSLRRFARRNQLIVFGVVVLALMCLVALLAPIIATHDPLKTDTVNRLRPPSTENWLGTDQYGRDVFSRLVYGSRVSVQVAFMVMLLTTLAGSAVGLVAGYNRRADNLLMRIMDGVMAFPAILLALAIIAILGSGLFNIVLAISIAYFPATARIVRGVVIQLRSLDFVLAAGALGASHGRIVVRHIVPNVVAPLLVQGAWIAGIAILSEAGLSFIGAGTPPPTPSWGNMLADGRAFIYHGYWLTVFPGIAIMIAVLGVNLLGDGLRDRLDPRMRGALGGVDKH